MDTAATTREEMLRRKMRHAATQARQELRQEVFCRGLVQTLTRQRKRGIRSTDVPDDPEKAYRGHLRRLLTILERADADAPALIPELNATIAHILIPSTRQPIHHPL